MAASADSSEAPKRRVMIVIGALMLTMLLAALDQTIVSTALPTIVGDLGGLTRSEPRFSARSSPTVYRMSSPPGCRPNHPLPRDSPPGT